jgi:quinol monooxygenase YgiN
MAFIQIIEYQTKRFDDVTTLLDKFRANSTASTAPARATVTKDRDRPDTYVSIIEFDSYEKAMENSKRPETGEMAKAMAELCDGPPKFLNLDVIDQTT